MLAMLADNPSDRQERSRAPFGQGERRVRALVYSAGLAGCEVRSAILFVSGEDGLGWGRIRSRCRTLST
jgi:hypothetical protein